MPGLRHARPPGGGPHPSRGDRLNGTIIDEKEIATAVGERVEAR